MTGEKIHAPDAAKVGWVKGAYQVADAKKETKTSRADVNALRVLRSELRGGILAAWQKLEPRVKDAIRDRADMGAVQVQVTVDLRPAE